MSCCATPCSCPEACCPNFPFATVTMTVPPPIILPTVPTPVKPLQLPSPCPCEDTSYLNDSYDRYDNYYNNYNVDWHGLGRDLSCTQFHMPGQERGVAVDGKPALTGFKKCCVNPYRGCPTGFKPCRMELKPPPMCDPCGTWCAKVMPCPPKRPKCKPRPAPWKPSPDCRQLCPH